VRLEVVKGITEALKDGASGLLAKLLSMPLPAGVTVLDGQSSIEIINGLDDDDLVKGENLDRGRDILLLVTPDGGTSFTPANFRGSQVSLGVTPVAVTVIHRGMRTPSQKIRDAECVIRAILLSLTDFFNNSARLNNEVILLRLSDVTYGLVQDDGVGAVGAVVFNVQAFDKAIQALVR